jgi:hypothetical protein
MELRHGGLVIDLPEGWSDQSTLLFVAPPPALVGAVPAANAVAQPTEAVSLRFAVAGGREARALLEEQTAALRRTDPALSLVEEGPFSAPFGRGWRVVQRLSLGGIALRQIAVACLRGEVALLATAVAGDAAFARAEETLLGILGSLRAG